MSLYCSTGDHIFGLLPLLASRLDGAGGMIEGVQDTRTQASVLDSSVSKRNIMHLL